MICTFFGHADSGNDILPRLRTVIIDLIEKKNVDHFYVGHQGNFDNMVYRLLKELKETYPTIQYDVVLAYRPNSLQDIADMDWTETVFIEELEDVSPRFSIVKRNTWMLNQADYIVAHVVRSYGGAARFIDMAKRKQKNILYV